MALKLPPLGINLSSASTYESGAALLAALAWPEALGDDAAMGHRHAVLCQLYLQARADADPEWAATPQPIKPLYLTRPSRDVKAFERQLHRRLRARMAAARIALPFIIEDDRSGAMPYWPRGSLSLNRMAERVIDDTSESDTANVKSRVWRPSRPVIHIAAAVATAVEHGAANGLTISVVDLWHHPDVLAWTVDTAIWLADLIPGIPRLRIAAGELVPLHRT